MWKDKRVFSLITFRYKHKLTFLSRFVLVPVSTVPYQREEEAVSTNLRLRIKAPKIRASASPAEIPAPM